MKIQQSFSIVTKTAENPGNITTIMAGVHGNELAGVFAIQDLLAEQIQPIAGKIHFILANLKGLEIEQRAFEKNMNRCFREENNMESYEEQRVKEILPYLKESDFLLDVHNTLSEKNSIPLLISEYPEIDPYFNVDYTASGFDQLHPGGSDGYMNSVWKVGLCLEAGSIHDHQENVTQKAKDWILNFLKFTGNIAGNPIIYPNKKRIHFDFIYRNQSPNFRFIKQRGDFEEVKKWEILGYDGNFSVVSDRNGVIIFACWSDKIGWECFCLGCIVN